MSDPIANWNRSEILLGCLVIVNFQEESWFLSFNFSLLCSSNRETG